MCAKVRLRLDQQATLTRSAFNGALDINNGSQLGSLTGVKVTLDFRDEAGNSVNDRFFVQTPRLSGLTGVDGTGSLGASSNGSAQYTIIPTKTAAPTAPTVYTVGGSLRYIDPDGGQEVVVPLLGATITVYPDPNLELDYFWQRDVIGDDPFTDAVEPSEPFALGIIVTNSGNGNAKNFTITSSQPQIVENEKGLLIDFKIVGTQVDVNAVTPSLTANFGDIGAGQTVVGQWLLESTLQGKFIDYTASFTHADDLGGKATSLIDTVRIHELIRSVRVAHPTDDGRPDFLANDVPDADRLPDTLYLSSGAKADVKIATNAAASGGAAPGSLSATVTATMTSGWNYFSVIDPGAGYRVASVTRSDNTALPAGSFWQTSRTFPAGSSAAISENRLHILDKDGTGSYTVTYLLDDTVAPQLLDVVDVSPDPQAGGIASIDVVFSEPIDLATFTFADLSLTRNGGANLITGPLSITQVSGGTYRVGGLAALTGVSGVYEFTAVGAGIKDFGGNAATGSASDRWAVGDAPPFVDTFAALAARRTTAVDSVDVTFSKPIDGTTFTFADITLTRNGGANLADSRVAVALVSGSTWRISGLAGLTGTDGEYGLSVNAAGVADAVGTAGVGSGAVTWIKDSAVPTVQSVEAIATTPRNIVVPSVTVTFSEAIDPATFTRADLTLTRNGAAVTVDDRVTVEQVTATTFKVAGINWFTGQEGTYVLAAAATSVADLAGNVGTGSASTTWVMDTTAPAAPTNLAIVPDTGASATDGLTNSKTVTLSGTLAETGLSVRLVDLVTNKDLGYATVTGTSFAKQITVTADGQNRIQVRVVDAAGNVNMESRLLQPGGYFDVFYDGVAPLVTGVGPVSPAPRTTTVSSVDVTFSEAIDPATFNWQDVTLTRDGGGNLATSGITIAAVFGLPNTYRIGGLATLTGADGGYRLAVNGGGLADAAGNVGANSQAVEWLMNAGGTVRQSTLTGRVFHDYDGNGSFDDGDLPLAGWTAFLDVNGSGGHDAGDEVGATDAAGRYAFSGLAAGNYQVGLLPPEGWNRSLPTVAGGIYLASVATGATTGNLDFGFYRPGEIRGLLYNDANSNGVRDGGEAGLAGWTVYLDEDGDGSPDSGERTAITSVDGSYVFTGLTPATYAVATAGRTGWRQTSPGFAGGSDSQRDGQVGVTGLPQVASFVIFDQRCPCVASTLTSFATALPTSADGSRFAWADADPSTPDVVDVRYDFRGQTGYANLITAEQITLAERAFGMWEAASGGALRFFRDTTAPSGGIINIGVGDLAALGGTSAARNVLGLGGAVFAPLSEGGLRSGVAWLDMAESWELNYGNGNVSKTFDFFSVVAHEIGHALGLEHLDAMPSSDLMDSTYGGERTTFSVADSTGVRGLYQPALNDPSTGGFSGWVIVPAILPGTHVVNVFSGSVITGLEFGNVDTQPATPPTVAIASGASALKIGDTATITFTLSEPSSDFAADDVTAVGGALSNWIVVSGTVYKATFTPTSGFTGSGTVSVAEGRFTNSSGTANTAGSLATAIAIDTQAPAAPAVSLTSDTGISGTDRVTKLGSLSLSGTEAGATVEFSADGGKTWADFKLFAPAEGANSVLLRQTDVAGNTSDTSAAFEFTLDTQAAAAPAASLVSDTGVSSTDRITKLGGLSLYGTEAGATVEFSADGGKTWADFKLFTPVEGANSVLLRQTDVAGNTSDASAAFDFTLDTNAPAVGIASDRAELGFGQTATITFTLSEASTDFTVDDVTTSGGSVSGWTVISGTVYKATFTPTVNFVGSGTVAVAAGTFGDAAGNANAASSLTPPITVNTAGPAAPTLALDPASDSATKGDLLTNVTLPKFAGTAPAGMKVNVYRVATGSDAMPTLLGTASVSAATGATTGSWTLTTPSVAPFTTDGWTVIARTLNKVGAESVDTSIDLEIDAATPVSPADLNLAPESDTGIADDDNYTSDTTPTITGTAEDGATVTVFANDVAIGTTAVVGGMWSLAPATALKAGTYAITAKATDAAGNVGPANAKTGVGSLSIVIDTTVAAPSTPDLVALDDKGSSSTDNKTSVTTPTFTGTAEAFAVVTLLANGDEVGTGTADTKGAWSITTAGELADGSYRLTAVAVDKAGNVSPASKALTPPLIINTAAPGAPTVLLDAKSDSGTKADGITNATVPTFTGFAPVGTKVNVYRMATGSGDTPTLLGTAAVTAAKNAATGVWTLATPTKQPFTANDWDVIAKAVSEFGVESDEDVLSLTVDTVAPAAPADVDLASGSDSGTASDDNYTSDTTPTITGTAEDGSTVTVLANTTVIGTAVTVDGVWSLTPSVPLKAGTYVITAKATDAAGNAGPASTKTGAGSLSIVIDTTAAAPTVPDLVAADDKGSSSTDNKTNVTTPTFSGTAEAFATVKVLANGNAVGTGTADSKGAWRIKLGTALPDGTYSMTATVVDKAGNASVASKALTPQLMISTALPAAPAVTLSASGDSGAKGDGITNITTPAFNGSAPSGSKVNLYRVESGSVADPVLLGTASVTVAKTGPSGTWSLTTPAKQPFTDAVWRAIAKTGDAFGNESQGAEVSVTVSRAAPTVTGWSQESTQAVTVTFSRPVTGVKASSFRYIGVIAGQSVDLPVTDTKVKNFLGTVTVAPASGAGTSGSTWRITFAKPVPAGTSFTLKLKAAGAGIIDDIGNVLAADSQVLITG